MRIIEINSLSHPGVEVFATLSEAQLRNRLEPQKGIFIAAILFGELQEVGFSFWVGISLIVLSVVLQTYTVVRNKT